MRVTLASIILMASLSVPALAQTPPGLRDLVGARGSSGETQLQARGYRYVSGQTGDDRVWTNWWNARLGQCVTVATVNGRYDSITETPAPDCGQGSASEGRDDRRPGSPASGADDRDINIGLVCFGEGQRPELATRYGWQWNERRGRYDYGNRTEIAPRDFDAAVTVQVWGDGGRILLPRKLIPPINSRGNDGWWDLTNVDEGPDQIRATYRLNGLNRPKVTIDRRSGRISIQGTGDYAFRGTCDRADGDDHRRF
ncbi:hypothetical protein [Allosphingosinicella indica]|uniref:Uncharacterized protein n=1 Tax=Allosphingosinicella indica TaxID=941907 RepID=A0A1X7G030_9SPHN|nr:hypothetical protein [Allosphingosinicella indica]SMF61689.1 hypothetical protein SAMN06295910_0681 [Allosphingosinicella indica]